MKLIGIKGRLHSGKDTAFEIIRDTAKPKVVERRGFADKMKLSGVRALGFEPRDTAEALLLANAIKETGAISVRYRDPITDMVEYVDIDGRTFWQLYGTEAHRDVYGQDFHVKALLPSPLTTGVPLRDISFPGIDVLVITDVRFVNEAQRILDLGGEVWQIDAEKRLGPLPAGAHSSEQPLPSGLVSVTIPNNDSLQQFEFAVRATYELSNEEF